MNATKQWYILRIGKGFEKSITHFEKRLKPFNLTTNEIEIILPIQTHTTIKNGRQRNIKRSMLPGYALVGLSIPFNSKVSSLLESLPCANKFLSAEPMSPIEAKKYLDQVGTLAEEITIDISKGDFIIITDGPFTDFTGIVTDIQGDRVHAEVSIFNTPTPIEIDILAVKKTDEVEVEQYRNGVKPLVKGRIIDLSHFNL